jgi:ubiquinone/menaquinone biosynthesis C-methylase UbiE
MPASNLKADAVDFYDNIAEIYDDMTSFESRLEKERAIMHNWVEHYHIESAVDVACGTGLYEVILSQLGVHDKYHHLVEELE